MNWVSVAYAMGGAGQGSAQQGGLFSSPLVPLIIMMAIFYFLLIRPQQKKQKEHRAMLGNLKKGDRVVTQGGLHGRITGLTDSVLTIEIADKVQVKLQRGYVAALWSREESNEAKLKAKSDQSKD